MGDVRLLELATWQWYL